MELEVGMFVRTKIGIIGKIISIDKDSHNNNVITIFNGNFHIIHNETRTEFDITKVSYNIIDILELGDIVEVFMEMYLDKEDTNTFEVIAITTDKKEIGVFGKDLEIDFIPIENIKRILTKEQFSQMAYKIGD